jgi:hypothetical protein
LTRRRRLSILLDRLTLRIITLTEPKEVYRLDIPPDFEIPPGFSLPTFHGARERLDAVTDEMMEKVRRIACPKAVYTTAGVSCEGRDHVEIDGIRFTSRILNKKICHLETVYPFITTVGKELDELKAPPREIWQSFVLDSLKTLMLISAVQYVTDHIKEEFGLSEVAQMNPGELKDWPIEQQVPFFRLFDGKEKAIGISVSKGGAMRPLKSRSGIIFPDDTGFVSCRCCPRENCPGRRAPYDTGLVEELMK